MLAEDLQRTLNENINTTTAYVGEGEEDLKSLMFSKPPQKTDIIERVPRPRHKSLGNLELVVSDKENWSQKQKHTEKREKREDKPLSISMNKHIYIFLFFILFHFFIFYFISFFYFLNMILYAILKQIVCRNQHIEIIRHLWARQR